MVWIYESSSQHTSVISHRLQQVDENRKSVTNEIKKSICNLIMEINRKGKILVNQLEVSFICTAECCFKGDSNFWNAG